MSIAKLFPHTSASLRRLGHNLGELYDLWLGVPAPKVNVDLVFAELASLERSRHPLGQLGEPKRKFEDTFSAVEALKNETHVSGPPEDDKKLAPEPGGPLGGISGSSSLAGNVGASAGRLHYDLTVSTESPANVPGSFLLVEALQTIASTKVTVGQACEDSRAFYALNECVKLARAALTAEQTEHASSLEIT